MPFINLIEEQRSLIRAREKRARLFFMTFSGASIAGVVAFAGLFLQTERVNMKISSANKVMTRIQPVLNEIGANDKKLSELSPRLTTLEDAQTATRRWSKLLTYLVTNSPERMWLTQIKCNGTNPYEPVVVAFSGVSNTLEDIGNFQLRLKALDSVTEPKLKFTQPDPMSGPGAIKFELNAQVVGSALPKPEKKTKKQEEKEKSA